MVDGQAGDPGPIRHPAEFFIGGRWVPARRSTSIAIRNSATEELYFHASRATDAEVLEAVAAARAAFDEGPWPHLDHAERADHLRELGRRISQRAEHLGRIWSTQTGILHSLAIAHVERLGALFGYYAHLGETFPFVERHEPSSGGGVGLLVREPVGVVAAIIPWNGALSDITAKVAPALLAGCTVVLKPSPQAPGEAYAFAEIVDELDLPSGVLNLVLADGRASERLVRDERVDKVAFTGSTAVGRRIASLLGDRVGRFTLELGGKSAAVVLEDGDVESAADTLTASTIRLSGQACSALTRAIVTPSNYDDLVDALVDRFGKVRLGDPFDPAVDMGPLVSERHRQRVERYVTLGIDAGASLVTGGHRPGQLPKGYFLEPTVFADVDNSTTIAQEEIFGPVLCVIKARDEDDAVRIANETIYGLNASVFTTDPDRALSVARRLRSGTVGHNALRTDMRIARGGFKQSGFGREGGTEGLLGYLEPKTVILDGPASLVEPRAAG